MMSKTYHDQTHLSLSLFRRFDMHGRCRTVLYSKMMLVHIKSKKKLSSREALETLAANGYPDKAARERFLACESPPMPDVVRETLLNSDALLSPD